MTDGAAYDIAGVETVIKEAVQSSPTSAPLRTFSLGIGSGTSTELLESISIAGQGATLYVQEGENMSGKVNRLVKAARSPAVVDVQLSWPGMPAVQDEDEGFEVVDKPVGQEPQGPISLYTDSESDSQSESGPPSLPAVNPVIRSYEQCPSRLPPLLPGIRFGCYALIDAQRLSTFPQTLSVTGKVASSGETVSLDVPVTILPQETDSQHQSLHTIAAQRLILSLEKGTYDLPASIASQSELICQAHLKALAVHYGQTYNLTSKHTSFVAVDERGTKTVTRPVRSSRSNASSCFGAAPSKSWQTVSRCWLTIPSFSKCLCELWRSRASRLRWFARLISIP